jgi:hypothetical protein
MLLTKFYSIFNPGLIVTPDNGDPWTMFLDCSMDGRSMTAQLPSANHAKKHIPSVYGTKPSPPETF